MPKQQDNAHPWSRCSDMCQHLLAAAAAQDQHCKKCPLLLKQQVWLFTGRGVLTHIMDCLLQRRHRNNTARDAEAERPTTNRDGAAIGIQITPEMFGRSLLFGIDIVELKLKRQAASVSYHAGGIYLNACIHVDITYLLTCINHERDLCKFHQCTYIHIFMYVIDCVHVVNV